MSSWLKYHKNKQILITVYYEEEEGSAEIQATELEQTWRIVVKKYYDTDWARPPIRQSIEAGACQSYYSIASPEFRDGMILLRSTLRKVPSSILTTAVGRGGYRDGGTARSRQSGS